MHTLMIERFQPNNKTFSELTSSGRVNLISNEVIKKLLLELEQLYQTNEFGIEHKTFDYQEYISQPIVQHTDVQKLNYIFNNYKSAEELAIKAEDFDALFQSKKYKNGCIITNSMNEYVLIYLQQIEDKSKKVLDLIDQELINVDKSI